MQAMQADGSVANVASPLRSWPAESPAKRLRREPSKFKQWERPPVQATDGPGPLTFMQVDIDYYTKAPDPRFGTPSGKETNVPVLRMYGVTDNGNSVMAHIHGFEPYFYVQCPSEEQAKDPGLYKSSLEEQLKNSGGRDKVDPFVLRVEVVQRSSLMGWQGTSEHSPFFRVVVAVPGLIPQVGVSSRLASPPLAAKGTSRQRPLTRQTFRTHCDSWWTGGSWVVVG